MSSNKKSHSSIISRLLNMMILLIFLSVGTANCAAGIFSGDESVQRMETTNPLDEQVQRGQYISLAWFYKPPANGDIGPILQYFDMFILTKNDEIFRDRLISEGISGPIMQYLRFDAIQNPGSCSSEPWQNQVANRANDFCTITHEHPDWFLLNQSGNRITVEDGFVLMDPGNPEWRAFWLERAIESQENLGWYGVFLDNVEASTARFNRMGVRLQNYPEESDFQTAVEGFLEFIYTGYFQPEGRPLSANITHLEDKLVWLDYMQYLDGVMDENWATDWNSKYLDVEDWEADLVLAEETQAQGKYIILVAQGDREGWKRQRFAYGSYLLVTAGQASFRYANSSSYSATWVYRNYGLPMGAPLGPRYQQADGTWRRDYTNGYVVVDAVARDAQFILTQVNTRYIDTP